MSAEVASAESEYGPTYTCVVAGCTDPSNQGHLCAEHEKRAA